MESTDSILPLRLMYLPSLPFSIKVGAHRARQVIHTGLSIKWGGKKPGGRLDIDDDPQS
jgi:hypothetical protein